MCQSADYFFCYESVVYQFKKNEPLRLKGTKISLSRLCVASGLSDLVV
jgi:hypothetical protein